MRDILGTTRLVGVLGWPVEHSFSPLMQNAALAELGLDWAYVPLPVPPAALPVALAGLRAAGFVGCNATIPHKEALARLVDHATEEALLCGTVNTVHFTAQGVVGDSTDGRGLIAALAEDGCAVAGRRVALLGAGGAARGVGVALARAGVAQVAIINRTRERAEVLAAWLNEHVRPGVATVGAAPAAELARAELIVNTTSVGMHPRRDESPVELPDLLAGCWLVDIIYNPPVTKLMAAAAARGARVCNGAGMLAWQGALSLERWTGRPAPAQLMRQVLEVELARRLSAERVD